MAGIGLNNVVVNTAPVHVGNSKYQESIGDEYVDVIVGVFFDGTMNNRKNTNARLENEKQKKGLRANKEIADKFISAKKEDTSYYNDHSNVSRIEPFYEEINEEKYKQFSLYIEGIGTENYKKDSPKLGGGMGMGPTGVRAKVLKGCEELGTKAKKYVKDLKVNRLTIDVFGFSRGAAAARNFVHEISQNKGQVKGIIGSTVIYYNVDNGALGEELLANSIEIKLLTVRFVGLFDTVASHGIFHDNDTKDLSLDAIKNARYTLQLAAADEHRENFRLTNIKSASGKGVELFLPGVHSDIGGSYKDGTEERDLIVRESISDATLKEDRTFLIKEGWFKPDLINVSSPIYISGYGGGYYIPGKLTGSRPNLTNRYSFIPLNLMGEKAFEKKVGFLTDDISENYPIISDLENVKARIDSYAKGEANELSFDDMNDRKLLLKLREKYFHFSAHYHDKALLSTIVPMKPHTENGVRIRKVNDG
ncbi:T6SS phospholipase effector Tle1-like catalytic domain-containing protein [Zobellia laminariae]|uniref:T6SS phospholipase effector Tle1-like catalytic domain-containing protein n=1 Tax=Zobellia laminariae TaxID=248906 RepID=UPI003EF57D8D